MGKIMGLILVSVVAIAPSSRVMAAETLVDSVKNGYKTELETYCKPVTPGEGRLLACLYAYEDKLSGQCQYALYDSSIRLERAVAAINSIAQECRADIESHGASVRAGEGRIASCLKEHSREIHPNGRQARTDVGID